MLYSRTTTGAVQIWSAELNRNAYRQHYGQLNGKIQTTEWTYCYSKNVGKANETTGEDQAEKEVKALYKKKLKENYFENVADIDDGFKEPQLAKPCKDFLDKVQWERGVIVDEKLNGVACIITKDGARSRKNETFHAIPHIIAELKSFFEDNPNAYLHGELFNPKHVNELNKITELVAVTRKEKDITPELLVASEKVVEYHLYDGYGFTVQSPEGPLTVVQNSNGMARRQALRTLISFENSFKYIKIVNYINVTSFDEMREYANDYIGRGGEGVIIRNPYAPYQHKRTNDLLKYKKSESAEYKVISIEEGTANWSGCAKYVWVEVPNGIKDKKCKINVRGKREHLREVLSNREQYVGKMITVDYQELSPYNIPLINYTDLVVRDYE